jgi:hypothetical protein
MPDQPPALPHVITLANIARILLPPIVPAPPQPPAK